MLNPDQVARFRALLLAGTIADNPERYRFASQDVMLGPDAAIPATPELAGHFYPPERIFGAPVDPSCLDGVIDRHLPYPTPRLQRAAPGRIIGNNAVLDGAGELFLPDRVSATEAETVLRQNRYNHQGFILEPERDRLRATFVARAEPRRFAATALFLHNLEPSNYGSFMFRQLPQMIALTRHPVEFDYYVTPDRTSWFAEVLVALGLPERPVLTVRDVSGDLFDSVLFFNNLDAEGFLSPEVRETLWSLAAPPSPPAAKTMPASPRSLWQRLGGRGRAPSRPLLPTEPPLPTRLYVSRALSAISRPSYRFLENELEIEAMAVARGYEVIYPETLSLGAQMRRFAAARRIIGPSGSGMFNAAFAAPGTAIVDMESHHGTVRQHAKFYSSCRFRYAFLFGTIDNADARPLFVRAWQVPPDLASAAFDWLEAVPKADAGNRP